MGTQIIGKFRYRCVPERTERMLDVADSPVLGRHWCLADLHSSTMSMSASRPNAVIVSAGWLPISGHCIGKVDMADLLDDSDSPLLAALAR